MTYFVDCRHKALAIKEQENLAFEEAAVSLFQSPVNADIFHAWIIQELLPKLSPPCTVVTDNVAFHKRTDIR